MAPFDALLCVWWKVRVPQDMCALWRCVVSQMLDDYVESGGCCAGLRRLGVQVPLVGPHFPVFLLCVLWPWEGLLSLLVLGAGDNAWWVVWVH